MRQDLLFILFVITGLFCHAQQVPGLHQRVDSLVNAERQNQNIPGLSIVITRNGMIDYVQGYGLANIEHQVPAKAETIFQAGSVGKQFTAFAIMLLVEDGKIKLDDPISRFFPGAPPRWDAITVKHLLTHTSGFGEYPDGFNFRADYTDDSLYEILKKAPLLFPAGEKSVYSNMGYVTLGIIISKVTGSFYGEFLKERIFEPLGMTTARIISESDIVPNRAAGYRLVDGQLKNQEWVSPSINTTADGSMYVTALDMAKWEAGLNAGKLLKKESYGQLWSPVKLNDGSSYPYGFGWWIDSVQGKQILEHDGTWQGFEATIKRYPSARLAVIVFANLRRARTNKIATRILELYQPELMKRRKPAIEDRDASVNSLVRQFVLNLRDNKLKPDMFTTELGDRFIPRSARASEHLKSLGEFKGIELLERKQLANEMWLHHYRVLFTREDEELFITTTKDKRIAAIESSD